MMGTIAGIQLSLGKDEFDGATTVEQVRPELKKPSMYQVILLNDDYSPMEFVVEVLETFFHMNREKATQIMLLVHTQGQAVCGVYPRDIAETKMTQVNEFSRHNQHPLLCQVQAAD